MVNFQPDKSLKIPKTPKQVIEELILKEMQSAVESGKLSQELTESINWLIRALERPEGERFTLEEEKDFRKALERDFVLLQSEIDLGEESKKKIEDLLYQLHLEYSTRKIFSEKSGSPKMPPS
ncbi:MAG: hypothetical protein WD963_00795 [Candidatus Paceibacterota bacterium]